MKKILLILLTLLSVSGFAQKKIVVKVPGGGVTDTTSLSNRINAKQDQLSLTNTGTSGAATLVGSTLNIPNYATGSGTVTSVSGLSPLFSTATPTTTPTFSLNNQSAWEIFGNHTSGSAAPSWGKININSLNTTGTPASTNVLRGDFSYGAVPAPGSNTQVLYNNSGALGAMSHMTYNNSTGAVALNSAGGLTVLGNGGVNIDRSGVPFIRFLNSGSPLSQIRGTNGLTISDGAGSVAWLTANTTGVGIGVLPLSPYRLNVSGLNTGPTGRFTRPATGVFNSVQPVLDIRQEATGDMTDGFGSSIQFTIEDNAAVNNPIGELKVFRSGADNSGALQLSTMSGGVANNAMTLLPGGNIGIGTVSPAATAKLDIQSTTQGVLFPRMTQAQRTAIGSPAVGLIVYQTDGTEGVYVYKSAGWAFAF